MQVRRVGVVVWLLASAAFADVAPPLPKCVVPSECVTCGRSLGEADAGTDCRAKAQDAGLVLSNCTDRSGAFVSEYFCPSGKQAVRGCGCAGVEGGVLFGLMGVGASWCRGHRRRRSAFGRRAA